MAMLIKKVITVQAKIKRPPNFFKGAAKAFTKCSSHFEAVTAAAKPIAEQMAGTNVGLVMPLTNAWKALSGLPAIMHMTRPTKKSNMRVSTRFAKPIMTTTIRAHAHQISKVIFVLLFRPRPFVVEFIL